MVDEVDPLQLALQQLASTMGVSLPAAVPGTTDSAAATIATTTTKITNNKIETESAVEYEEGEVSEREELTSPKSAEGKRRRNVKNSPKKRKKNIKEDNDPRKEPAPAQPSQKKPHPSSAATKKVTSSGVDKKERPRVPCRYWMEGKCSKGEECTFSHAQRPLRSPEEARSEEVCRFHLAGTCLKGEACLYSHDLSRVPCKFFHVKAACSAGDTCRFSHAPISEQARHQLFAEMTGSRDPRLATEESVPKAPPSVAKSPFTSSRSLSSINNSNSGSSTLIASAQLVPSAQPTPPLSLLEATISPEMFLAPAVAKYNPFGSPFI